MNSSIDKFIQANSPDGGFLQSEEWRKFQDSYGRKTFNVSGENFWASIIEHKLKLVGKYFYVPRGPIASLDSEEFPISNFQFPIKSKIINSKISNFLLKITELAKKERAGWIRIEPKDKKSLDVLGGEASKLGISIKRAPHDMQPREIFVMDVASPEEQLLTEMKSKTRYNIKLSQKRGVSVKVISNLQFPISNKIQNPNDQNSKYYLDKFIDLVKVTAKRNEISAHPEEYYRKMWEVIPTENLKLYIAEYQCEVIAANLILYYGEFATYLHGASDNTYREVMAPYMLQWQAIQDAQKNGCIFYDFGGVSVGQVNKLQGVTKFKLGFSPETKPIEFPGSYDIIINSRRYYIYRVLQFIKNLLEKK